MRPGFNAIKSLARKLQANLLCSGEYESTDIVIFEYTRTRAGKHAEQFLKEFDGYLITDAYAVFAGVALGDISSKVST